MKWVLWSAVLILIGAGCQGGSGGGGGSGGAAESDELGTDGVSEGDTGGDDVASENAGGQPGDTGSGGGGRRSDGEAPVDNGDTDTTGSDTPATESDPDWPQQARLTAFDPDTADHYAGAVAADENTIAIGADEKASRTGAVDVFVLFGGEWRFHDRLMGGPSRSAEQGFGTSVAVTTQYVYVGAPRYAIESSFHIQRGAVYMFRNVGPGFELEQVISVPEGQDFEYFGESMAAISGQGGLVVGAPGWSGSQGAAYVVGGVGSVVETKVQLTASDGAANDKFGQAVAGNGQYIVVGSPNKRPGTGAAYVFQKGFNGDADWTELQKLAASDGARGDQFGASVAIDGEVIAIGAPYRMRAQDDLLSAGAVYIYEQDGSGGWSHTQTIEPTDEFAGLFGSAVALSGGTLAVGGVGKGRVVLYEYVGGEWAMTGSIAPTNPTGLEMFESFGESIAFVRDLLVVGARTALVQAENVMGTGAAYVFGSVEQLDIPEFPPIKR